MRYLMLVLFAMSLASAAEAKDHHRDYRKHQDRDHGRYEHDRRHHGRYEHNDRHRQYSKKDNDSWKQKRY